MNGKELQTENNLNWCDYGARYYDPQVGRFFTVDPKSENYIYQTTYSYAINRPIKLIDINGEAPPPVDDVFYQREFVRRTGDAKILADFERGMKQGFIYVGKVLKYGGNVALISLGGPIGIMVGISALGLQTGKDLAFATGGDKKKIKKTADTFTGIFMQATAGTFGGDVEKAGKIGEFSENILTSGMLFKPTKDIKDVIAKSSVAISLGCSGKELLNVIITNDEEKRSKKSDSINDKIKEIK